MADQLITCSYFLAAWKIIKSWLDEKAVKKIKYSKLW